MTVYGWDMSHFDAPNIGNAVGEGIRFITHKAGGDQDDPEISSWWSNVRNLGPGVLLGAYWVQYPDNARANASKRADEFLARLDATCPGWRDRDAFILQVDCEIWNQNRATAPTRAQIKAFCDRLVARTGGRYRPVVYAPRWAYGDTLTGLGYPLWASSYVTAVGTFQAIYPGDQSSRWGAYSGQTPAILQYSSSATIGGQTTCDANAYRGTLDQLKALVTPAAIQEVDMPTADDVWNKLVPLEPNAGPDERRYPAWNVLADIRNRVVGANNNISDARTQIATMGASLMTALQAIAAKDQVDEQALAAALGPAVAQAVLAGLPDDPDINVDEAMLTRAFRNLFTGQS